MVKLLKRKYLSAGAAFMMGALAASTPAHANNFGNIATNITTSIQDLPGLLTALSYMFGILLGVLGVMKIKDHVENPSQTPLKDGAIRLAAGGALFALPIIFEAMTETVDAGAQGQGAIAAQMNKVTFNVT